MFTVDECPLIRMSAYTNVRLYEGPLIRRSAPPKQSHYTECHCAECHYTECHYTECHYTECRGAKDTTHGASLYPTVD